MGDFLSPTERERALFADPLLRRWARACVWWKTPEEALAQPHRILSQVVALGDYADVQLMVDMFGDDALRAVVRQAEAGQLDARSWVYWHYRLSPATPGRVPPLPSRRIAPAH